MPGRTFTAHESYDYCPTCRMPVLYIQANEGAPTCFDCVQRREARKEQALENSLIDKLEKLLPEE